MGTITFEQLAGLQSYLIGCNGSLGISDDLINFWDGSIENKIINIKIIEGGGIIVSLFFLYILEWSRTDLEISTLLQQCHLALCRHC